MLNLGGGNKKINDCLNLDIYPFPNVDIVHDIEKRLPFDDNHFKHILASHSLEHCSAMSIPSILKECIRVLKPKGTLEIIVPCLESAMREFLNSSEEERWGYRIEYIFGNQNKSQIGQQLHKTGFTVDRLKYLCQRAGFIVGELYSEPNNISMVCLTIKCHKDDKEN